MDPMSKLETYRKVLKHRRKCPHWMKGFCVDCFGGGLSKYTEDLMTELKERHDWGPGYATSSPEEDNTALNMLALVWVTAIIAAFYLAYGILGRYGNPEYTGIYFLITAFILMSGVTCAILLHEKQQRPFGKDQSENG